MFKIRLKWKEITKERNFHYIFFYQSVQNNNKYSMYISHPLAIIRKGNEIESIY